MSKYTPGPWRLQNEREGAGINDYVWSDAESREEREDASSWCIATVHAREHHATRIANAKLIAAAPDMAEALAYIVRASEPGIDQSDDDLERFIANVRDIANKALARAGV